MSRNAEEIQRLINRIKGEGIMEIRSKEITEDINRNANNNLKRQREEKEEKEKVVKKRKIDAVTALTVVKTNLGTENEKTVNFSELNIVSYGSYKQNELEMYRILNDDEINLAGLLNQMALAIKGRLNNTMERICNDEIIDFGHCIRILVLGRIYFQIIDKNGLSDVRSEVKSEIQDVYNKTKEIIINRLKYSEVIRAKATFNSTKKELSEKNWTKYLSIS